MRSAELVQQSHGLSVAAAGSPGSPSAGVIHHPRLIPLIVAAIIAVAVAWIGISLSRWRRITWREQMDAPISLAPKEARWGGTKAAWKVFTYHGEVAHPSLVLLRVKNSGHRSVGQADIRRPITFTFPGRTVQEFTVTDCRGVTREAIQPPGMSDACITENRILLPRFAMRRGASFRLLVLLSGNDQGVHGKGYIRRGRVVHESRGRGPLARNVAFGAILVLLVGAQAGVTFSQAASTPSFCRSGRLTLEGSTAFAPVARQIGEAYTGSCHGATISVTAIATFNGLNALSSAGATPHADAVQLAMSDGPAPGGYPGLVGHQVGVIVFAVVVNKRAGVFNLTTADLRGIFLGTITHWQQVGGANLPVRIVGRTPASGTRRAFDQKVLGGLAEPPFSSYDCISRNAVRDSPVIRCEVADTTTLLQRVNDIPGTIGYAQVSDAVAYANVESVKLNGADPEIEAIERGSYPFWTVEYLYSYGQPAPGTLAAAFLAYLNNDTANDILRSASYIPCADRQQALVAAICRANQP
ncbi:MAG: PstS family phosphate ABC transporter substrate-binding protein [Streptosporangiaceae bacterium]